MKQCHADLVKETEPAAETDQLAAEQAVINSIRNAELRANSLGFFQSERLSELYRKSVFTTFTFTDRQQNREEIILNDVPPLVIPGLPYIDPRDWNGR